MPDPILLAREGPVATLTLNRPEALNVLDLAMVEALVPATAEVAADPAIRVLVVRGAGKHFMAGGDVKTFARSLGDAPEAREAAFAHLLDRVHTVVETLARMPQPVVARVHGAVAGFGLSLMNACDLAVASDDAYFAGAYRQLGVTPDGGGTWSLPRIVGQRRALEIFLLSERFDAARAHELGLVNRVVPAPELDAAVEKMVRTLAEGPREALAGTKRLLRASFDRSLPEQLRAEAASFAHLTGRDDFVEGVNAFVGKRAPTFGD